MGKLLQEINAAHTINFRDPDYEPGAVEREGAARQRYASRHVAATQALKGEVAKKLNAKVRSWKHPNPMFNGEEWVTLTLPDIKAGDHTIRSSISQDPFTKRYGLMVYTIVPRRDKSFITSSPLAAKVRDDIIAAWAKATGQKLGHMDVSVPVDKTHAGADMFHSPIRVNYIAPSEDVSASKVAAGIKAIVDTVVRYFK